VGAPDPIVVRFSVPTDREEEVPAFPKYYSHLPSMIYERDYICLELFGSRD